MKYFGTVWQKFRRKIVIPPNPPPAPPPPPSYPKKIFSTCNFLKHRMVPWRSFFGRVRETKFRQNREASPLLCLKLLDTRILPKHRSLSALRHKKNSTENLDSSPLPSLTHKFLRYAKISGTKKGSPGSFSVLWDNNFCIENLYIPLLGKKFLGTRNLLKHRRVPRRNFSPLWDENFSTKIMTPSCIKYKNWWWNWCLLEPFEN